MITHFNMDTMIKLTWDKEVCVRTSNPANDDKYVTRLAIDGVTHEVAKTNAVLSAVAQHEHIVAIILNNTVNFKTIGIQVVEHVKEKLDKED